MVFLYTKHMRTHMHTYCIKTHASEANQFYIVPLSFEMARGYAKGV